MASPGRGGYQGSRVAAVPILETRVDRAAETFRRNREENLRLLGEVRALEDAVRRQAENARERFAKRGQLLPRERVARLLDPGAPFLELLDARRARHARRRRARRASPAAAPSSASASSPARARWCSPTTARIKGGAISPMGLRKSLRAQEIARRNQLPLVNLVESARREPHLPGRALRRGRAHLRQPGAPVGGGHPAHVGGARLVDRGRRLPPGAVRLRDRGARAAPRSSSAARRW